MNYRKQGIKIKFKYLVYKYLFYLLEKRKSEYYRVSIK